MFCSSCRGAAEARRRQEQRACLTRPLPPKERETRSANPALGLPARSPRGGFAAQDRRKTSLISISTTTDCNPVTDGLQSRHGRTAIPSRTDCNPVTDGLQSRHGRTAIQSRTDCNPVTDRLQSGRGRTAIRSRTDCNPVTDGLQTVLQWSQDTCEAVSPATT